MKDKISWAALGLVGSKDGFLWAGVANSFVFLFVFKRILNEERGYMLTATILNS